MKIFISILIALTSISYVFAQEVKVEAYIYESGNRGYLNQVELKVFASSDTINAIKNTYSNKDGFVEFDIPTGYDYLITTAKDRFHTKKTNLDLRKVDNEEKQFMKIEMKRAPGYTFELTLAEKKYGNDLAVDAIKGTLIEVYNNTKRKESLVLADYQQPDFQVNLLKGNHYTILIRKKGYLAKRLEAFVDVEGCILCFEGLGSLTPGVTDNLTESNSMGVLLANVEMERVVTGKTLNINNLYYDLGKYYLKEEAKNELDKVITLIKDNPDVKLELGSHTDSRGKDDYNLKLSENRANSAVNYILANSSIDKERLVAKGYGERILTNECDNDTICDEAQHALNRRTELKILGTLESDKDFIPLVKMKRKEIEKELLEELMDQEQVVVKAGEEKPEFLEDRKAVEEESMKPPVEKKKKQLKKKTKSKYVEYKLVVKEAKKALTKENDLFNRYPNLIKYKKEKNKILYLFGDFKNRKEAMSYLSLLKKENPASYLVKLINGKLVN